MKLWSRFNFLAIFLLSACGSLPDTTIQGTMPLPGAELSRVAPIVGIDTELTASPTASSTATITATPEPTATTTLLPTLTSPPTDLPTATPTDTEVPTASPTASNTPEATKTMPYLERELIFQAEDGLQIVGTLFLMQGAPTPLPGVLILPMHIEDQTAWKPFARQLAMAGYAALTIDLRGLGKTGGAANWQQSISDVRLVWREFGRLAEVDESRTALMGTSLGANLALVAASAEPAIKTVVLISPGLNYNGITTLDAMGAYGARPIMLIGSKADPYAQNGAAELSKLAQGEVVLLEYEGSLHGTTLFISEPAIAVSIMQFLEQKVKLAAEAPPAQEPLNFRLGSFLLSLLASVAGALLIGASMYMAYIRLSKPTDVSEFLSIDELAPQRGLVLIKGTIAEVPKPLDKDERRPLVALRLLVEENDPDKGWQPRFDELKSTHFWLREARGLIWVAGDQLEKKQLGEGYYASTKQAEQALEILGEAKNVAWDKRLRYKLWELRGGQMVTVIGQVRQRLELYSTPSQPLVISPTVGSAPVKAASLISGKTRLGTIIVLLLVGTAMLCIGSFSVVNALLNWLG